MRASLEVADVVRAAGPAYRTTLSGHLSLHQLKIMSAIEHCRTAVLGEHVEACNDWGHFAPLRSLRIDRAFIASIGGSPPNALSNVAIGRANTSINSCWMCASLPCYFRVR